jgi:hypothetical protein
MAGGNTANKNLDIHDNNASWFNGGYALDVQGTDNNMKSGLVFVPGANKCSRTLCCIHVRLIMC